MTMDIKPLSETDINSLTELQPLDWPDILPLFNFYVSSPYCFPVKVIIDTKIAGVGTSIIHNEISWLAHIIVHKNCRNHGIGRKITQELIELSKSKNCQTLYLIATDMGAPVYEKVGFETETEYLFFKDLKIERNKLSVNVVPFEEHYKEQIRSLDKKITGENRFFQLENYLQNALIFQENNFVQGYYLPTFGEGLIIAGNESAGIELIQIRLQKNDKATFPIDNTSAVQFLYKHNFMEYKHAKRMRLGLKREWLPSQIYNRAGGNIG